MTLTRINQIEPDAVVQIDPREASDARFGGCLMIVTHTHPEHCEGYIQSPDGRIYPYRAKNDELHYIGPAKAIIESLQDYRKKASQEDDITLVVIKLL